MPKHEEKDLLVFLLICGAAAAAVAAIHYSIKAKLPSPEPFADLASLTGRRGTDGDELYMGDWILYDVSEMQTPKIAAAAKSMEPGQIAALVLGQPNTEPLVFKARVIPGGPLGRYTGEWVTQKPGGGPEFAEFAPHHVLAVT
jgi:hypothetical protein